jgi:UDP-glucose 4-epimerase
MSLLITGGAGYIGSVIAYHAIQQGYHCIVLDHKETLSAVLQNHPFIQHICADYGNEKILQSIFSIYKVDILIHCASFIEVGESVHDPLRYYDNNVSKTITLLSCMRHHGISNIIFSSSCAVYGVPQFLPLTEDHPRMPISPYGATKFMMEQILEDCCKAYGMNAVALRYFNAAGALPEVGLGECHEPETHLIPRMIEAAMHDKPISIFGNDYDTPDGTCIRDFIHVSDLAQAHLKAIEFLKNHNGFHAFNIGTGKGNSILELIEVLEECLHKKIQISRQERRAGDPAELIANCSKTFNILQFKPKKTLGDIIDSAVKFHRGSILINNGLKKLSV